MADILVRTDRVSVAQTCQQTDGHGPRKGPDTNRNPTQMAWNLREKFVILFLEEILNQKFSGYSPKLN